MGLLEVRREGVVVVTQDRRDVVTPASEAGRGRGAKPASTVAPNQPVAASINVATVQELIWPLRLQLAWVALLAEEDEEC